MRRFPFSLGGIAIGLVSLVLGLASTAPAAHAQTELRVAHFSEMRRNAQIHWAFGSQDTMPLMAFFDSLTYVDENKNVVPGLVTAWEAEGTDTWTLEVRRGVKFHNGKPFTAHDIVQNVNYLLSDEGKVTSAARQLIRTISGARAIDDYTVEISTKQPSPVQDRWFALFRVMDVDYFNDVGVEQFGLKPIGTGAFRVTDWAPESFGGVAFDNGWRKPKIDRIKFLVTTEGAARVQALTSKQVDLAWVLLPDDIAKIEASDGKVVASPMYGVAVMAYNIIKEDSPFQDIRVRRALNYAVNKQSFVDNVLHGLTQPGSHPATKETQGFQPDIKPYPYDPDKASALLAEAGYGNGLKVTAEIVQLGEFGDMMQAAANDLSKIGVELELINLSIPEFVQRFIGRKEWDGHAISSQYEFFPTADAMRSLVTQSCSGRGKYICDQRIQPTIEAANKEMDPAKRAGLVSKVLNHYHDEALALFIHERVQIDGMGNNLMNYKFVNRAVNWHELEFAN